MNPGYLSAAGTSPARNQVTTSVAVLQLPEPPMSDDSGSAQISAWVESLFREPLLVLRFYGLPFSSRLFKQDVYTKGTKDRRRALLMRTLFFVFPALCPAYSVHCATSLLLALKRSSDAIVVLLPDASDLCRVAVSLLTAAHAARNGPKVLALARRSAASMLETRSTSLGHHAELAEWSALRRTVLASSSFALISFGVFVGLRVSTLRRRGIRGYCDAYLYGFAPSGDNGGAALYVLPTLDALLYGVVLVLPRWSIALHVSLCHFLGALGKQLSTNMQLASEARDRQLGVAMVRELRLRHAALCRAIGRCDDLYGWLLYFWCSDAVLCFVFGVPWIMAGADVDDSSGYAAASVDVTLSVLLLVAIFVAGSEPGRLAKESLTPHVLRLSCCHLVPAAGATRKEDEVALNQELLLLATAVRAARVEMTGWNCFDVHRGSTITILSMLATYAVIVYQMLHNIG